MRGVEVFSAGTQTDSQGQPFTFSVDDLERMAEQFRKGQPGYVPVKLGHTSDEFNAMVAEQLGLPSLALSGEGGVDGVASLGQIVNLYRKNRKLMADLEVPVALAEMISNRNYNAVSLEMEQGGEGSPWTVTGIALLGAERPAVKDLAPLAASAILRGQRTPAFAFRAPLGFTAEKGTVMSWFEKLGARLGITDDTPDDEIESKFKAAFADGEDGGEGDGEAGPITLPAFLAKLLGLEDSASDDDIIEEIRQLLGLAPAGGGGDELMPEGMGAVLKERLTGVSNFKDSAEFRAAVERETKPLRDTVAALQLKDRKASWREQTVTLKLTPGTPDELAQELIDVEDAMGKDAADKRLADWKRYEDLASDATRAIGGVGSRPAAEDEDPFITGVVKPYMEKHDVGREKALAQLALDPATSAQFNEYRRRVAIATEAE